MLIFDDYGAIETLGIRAIQVEERNSFLRDSEGNILREFNLIVDYKQKAIRIPYNQNRLDCKTMYYRLCEAATAKSKENKKSDPSNPY